MRTFRIVGPHLRKKVRTAIPEASATPVPDLLRRDFAAREPNTKYVGDITCLPIGNGQFLYFLAMVLGLCSKRLTGWSMAGHMRTSLVTEALRAAAEPARGRSARGDISQRQRGAICVEGVCPGLLGAGRDQITRRGRHKCGQRRRGESERDREARDAAGPQAVERGR
ncbi:DDE-type integrase/transposase/recombinase [Streptomyces malaysiensis]|uniref:DDE-type integrase/transposase/recombinase n=1 Tax=Streptomyces malaysiensis TaxID=92644 RepID=UPI00384BB8CD